MEVLLECREPEKQSEFLARAHAGRGCMSIRQVIDAYLTYLAADVPDRHKKTQECLERLLGWCERRGIDRLDPALWKEYKFYLAKGDRIREYAPMKGQLIAKHEMTCCVMFRHALKQGWIAESPLAKPTN